MSRIFTTSFASVYPRYVTKVEKKGRSKAELDQVIEWLTSFDESMVNDHLASGRQGKATLLQRRWPKRQAPETHPEHEYTLTALAKRLDVALPHAAARGAVPLDKIIARPHRVAIIGGATSIRFSRCERGGNPVVARPPTCVDRKQSR